MLEEVLLRIEPTAEASERAIFADHPMTRNNQGNRIASVSRTDRAYRWFWRAVRSYSPAEREQLLQFVTGSRRPPAGGFAQLQGFNGGVHKYVHWHVGSLSGPGARVVPRARVVRRLVLPRRAQAGETQAPPSRQAPEARAREERRAQLARRRATRPVSPVTRAGCSTWIPTRQGRRLNVKEWHEPHRAGQSAPLPTGTRAGPPQPR